MGEADILDHELRLPRLPLHHPGAVSLLELLMRHAGEPVKRADILREVWGYEFTPSTSPLDVYVGYLRRKTEAGGGSRLVQNVRGVGYAIREAP